MSNRKVLTISQSLFDKLVDDGDDERALALTEIATLRSRSTREEEEGNMLAKYVRDARLSRESAK